MRKMLSVNTWIAIDLRLITSSDYDLSVLCIRTRPEIKNKNEFVQIVMSSRSMETGDFPK